MALPPAVAVLGIGGLALASVADLPTNAAVLLATASLCLIALELNRPGLILPGALGLLLLLLAAAALLSRPLRLWAAGMLVLAVGGFALNLWKRLPAPVLALLIAAVPLGLRFLVRPPRAGGVHPAIAALCGLTLGLLGASLSRIAFRARRLKAVN